MRLIVACVLPVLLVATAQAAETEGLEVPDALDDIPPYCAKFLKRVLEQPIDEDLLSLDNWECNMTLVDGWDDSRAQYALINAAHTACDRSQSRGGDRGSKPKGIFDLGERDQEELFAAAIKKLQAGWKPVSVDSCAEIVFKKPDELVLFTKEGESEFEGDEFLRFLISRLGLGGNAACRCFKGGRAKKMWYLWIKKDSLVEFQEMFTFDLGSEVSKE